MYCCCCHCSLFISHGAVNAKTIYSCWCIILVGDALDVMRKLKKGMDMTVDNTNKLVKETTTINTHYKSNNKARWLLRLRFVCIPGIELISSVFTLKNFHLFTWALARDQENRFLFLLMKYSKWGWFTVFFPLLCFCFQRNQIKSSPIGWSQVRNIFQFQNITLYRLSV